MHKLRGFLRIIQIAILIGYGAVCWHSVEEIHYLKSFFPDQFTVEQAFYASAIELIKIVIIGIPSLLILGFCWYLSAVSKPR